MKMNQKIFTMLTSTLVCASLVGGCASRTHTTGKRYTGAVPNYYIVKRGDTVSKISNRYGLNYRKVARLNNLDANYTIYVNQRLRLSGTQGVSNYKTPAQNWKKRQTNANRINTQRINKPTPRPQLNTVPVTTAPTVSWHKPSNGRVIQNYDFDANIKGVRYAGSLGDPVYASQSGEVIYANNGLVEYGNLILIRHPDNYITAYAHNQRMLVKEGQRVSGGSQIATMGSTGTDRVMLEFQVRKSGKAIDPRIVLGQ